MEKGLNQAILKSCPVSRGVVTILRRNLRCSLRRNLRRMNLQRNLRRTCDADLRRSPAI